MNIQSLITQWSSGNNQNLGQQSLETRLTHYDMARLSALFELFPKRKPEALVSDLLSTALDEVEAHFPYVESEQIISRDEMGDPVYGDAGLTPHFIRLTKTYYKQRKANPTTN